MYVMRVEWQVKQGRMQEALAAVKKIGLTVPRFPRRFYVSHLGQFGRLTYDMELESLDEWRKINEEFSARPEGAEFWKMWNELVVGGNVQAWSPVDL